MSRRPHGDGVGADKGSVPNCETGPLGRLSWTFREIVGMFRAPRTTGSPRSTRTRRGTQTGDDCTDGMDLPETGPPLP